MSLTIGGLFSGYGGLEMGVQAAIGGRIVWHSEIEPGPCKVLAHHWPNVPNLGDITAIDWPSVEPVDVMSGGSPCQDVSAAGRRAGMRPGTRSGLWESMREGIAVVRPRLVVWENVRGVTSAEAHSDVEPCAGCVGGGDDGPVLRALGRVLGDLADLGYDAQWRGLRAADVGAPHGRFRVFVVATDAESAGRRGGGTDTRTDLDRAGHGPLDGDVVATDPNRARRQGNGTLAARTQLADAVRAAGVVALASGYEGRLSDGNGGTPPADAERGRRAGRAQVEIGQPLGRTATAGAGADLVADTECQPWRASEGQRRGPSEAESAGPAGVSGGYCVLRTDWGAYGPAIRRWEHTLGRVAPAPTELGTKGNQRLSPAFVEWMMGLPASHVTDPEIGLTRNEQLKALGNGVVPQQAAAAIRVCLQRAAVAA